MLFNSLSYALFLPIVFLLYWFVFGKNHRWQNLLLLICSYFFYGCWDVRFLFLLIFSTGLDFYTGKKIFEVQSSRAKKTWLWISIGINLGLLGVFKYYNFFIDSMKVVLAELHIQTHLPLLEIILPVGISFYTFHGLSYVIDIYKNRIEPETNPVDYSLFVSYFPLLVAGPIERATHLLPQIKRNRVFSAEKATDGIHQIIWGLFKKVVIADTCAPYVNAIFDNYEQMDTLSLLLGAVYFAFQIYGDFSGYSDIALGTSKLFGIDLLRNFNFPYFSRDIAEFWRRWHISLSSWFKDYLYIPLGGSKGGKWMRIRNTFIIFLVSGFWHGANWTFLVWGFLNALYFLPLLLSDKNRNHIEIVAKHRLLPSGKEVLQMTITFLLSTLAWIFFRAETVQDAVLYLKRMFSFEFSGIQQLEIERYNIELIPLILFLILMEWQSRTQEHPFTSRGNNLKLIVILAALLMWGVYSTVSDFIYFQF